MKNTIIVKDIDLFYRPYFNDKIIYIFRTFNLCAMKFMEKRSSTQFRFITKGRFRQASNYVKETTKGCSE